MGTPARRVLFESHRDGRGCRVARDSSSSDSNLLVCGCCSSRADGALFLSCSFFYSAPVRDQECTLSLASRRTEIATQRSASGLVNDRVRSSSYSRTLVPVERGARDRVQDRGLRSSIRPRSFMRISWNTSTIVSLSIVECCPVDILRCKRWSCRQD